ncbi:MAG: MotA/TolQ/ExbB proton channel family protein [Lentisphaeria bacterium]
MRPGSATAMIPFHPLPLAPAAATTTGPWFQELMANGGPIMWLILGCSLAALYLILERLLTYHRARIDVPEFLLGIFNTLRRNNAVEAITLCDHTPGPVARVLRFAILHADRDEASLRHAVEEASLGEVPILERNLKALATIAHLAPMLGLLGTVLGMIGAFQEMQGAGAYVSTSQLATHIWKALLTAAGGMAVAIPCYAFYNLLVSRVESLTLDMEKAASEMIYFLTHNKIRLDGTALAQARLADPFAVEEEAKDEEDKPAAAEKPQ